MIQFLPKVMVRWKKSNKYKMDLKRTMMMEVGICQSTWKNRGEPRNLKVGKDSYFPNLLKKIGEEDQPNQDMSVEFIHKIGRWSFTSTISELVDDMLEKNYGCTTGKGVLLKDYGHIENNDKGRELVEKAIDWHHGESKEQDVKKADEKKTEGDGGADDTGNGKDSESKGKKEVKRNKYVGDYESCKKMFFPTSIYLVGPRTYIRALMALVRSISNFWMSQSLNMSDFTLKSIMWDDKRNGVGIPSEVWTRVGEMLVRNMRKSFPNQEIYLHPLLLRRNLIAGAVGAACLMPSDLSFMMNGGKPDEAFQRLCAVSVLSCKADIPENSVHSIHQYLLNGLNRSLFLSNKTTFQENLWSHVQFEDEDADLQKLFQVGKPS